MDIWAIWVLDWAHASEPYITFLSQVWAKLYLCSNQLIFGPISDNEFTLCSLEEATGLAFRFIIGKTADASKMAELKKEAEEYDDFVMLDIVEEYSKLPYKTLVPMADVSKWIVLTDRHWY